MKPHKALRRQCATALTIAFFLIAAVPTPTTSSRPRKYQSGLEIVGVEALQSRSTDARENGAFWYAWNLAETSPNDFGYPWMDGASGLMHLRATSPRGWDLAQSVGAAGPLAMVRSQVEDSGYSFADLEAIREGIDTEMSARNPTYANVRMTEPDHINNRVIVTVNDLTDALLLDLAAKYGTAALAVREIPGFNPVADAGQRNFDHDPFYGGSKIFTPGFTCTSAFAWTFSDGSDGMLTAAHCIPNGGNVSRPVPGGGTSQMGWVNAGARENWEPNWGTVPYTGQTALRGDVALMRIDDGKESRARIWVGGTATDHWEAVTTYYPESWIGEEYYVSGQTSGVTGPYSVNRISINIYYWNENATAKNVTEGAKPNYGEPCTESGDSGAPVYAWYWGGVAAIGVHSGTANIPLSTCFTYFTDIQKTINQLPGTVKVAS